MVYRSSSFVSVTTTESDVCECFQYNVGTAISELVAATSDSDKRARFHLEKAQAFLRRELARNENLRADSVLDGPIEFDASKSAQILLISNVNPFLQVLFRPDQAKDIRNFGRISKQDIFDCLGSIEMALTQIKDNVTKAD